MYNKTFIKIMILFLTATVLEGQFSPIWQASAYIEAQSVTVVNNNQKTTGVYSFPISFGSIYLTPKLALGTKTLKQPSPSSES
jgi:hypothetical protein